MDEERKKWKLYYKVKFPGGYTMSREITVAAGQLGPMSEDMGFSDEERRGIVERMVNLVKKGNEENVDVICFPESSLSPFFIGKEILEDPREKFFDDVPNELTKPLLKKAKEYGIALILPYSEKDGEHFYNSAIVFNESGEILGKYRKTHIALVVYDEPGKESYEKIYYEPGNLGFPVFSLETAEAKIGVQICYDKMFPEGYRALAMNGAEIIFNPANLASFSGRRRIDTWGRCLQSRAAENQVFVVGVNKSGTERGRHNVGKSMIISPRAGEIIKQGNNEGDELVATKIDLGDIYETRFEFPLTRDMRPEIYKKHLFNLYDPKN